MGFAALFFVIAWQYLSDFLGVIEKSPQQGLGYGWPIFQVIMNLAFTAVFVFLPFSMASIFPGERERGDLDLLWITGLRPVEILVEKFLSRLLPMGTLLLITLPLLALTYSFGGITTVDLWGGFYFLLLTCLQVGGVAVWFSCACRTTIRAVLWTYGFCALFYLLFPILVIPLVYVLDGWFFLFPPALYYKTMETSDSFSALVGKSLPIVVSVVVFLWLARSRLIKQVVTPPRAVSLHKLGFRRRLWTLRHHGRIRQGLPRFRPVAWLESGRRSFLSRYFPFLFALTASGIGPILLMFGLFLMGNQARVFLLWGVAILAVSLVGVNTMVLERINRTLDVLLATPMAGHEILRQKSRGLRRFLLVFPPLFLILFLAESNLKGISNIFFLQRKLPPMGIGTYWALSLSTVLIYLPLFYYFSVWIGLKMKSHRRARLIAVLAIAVWIGLPLLLQEAVAAQFPDLGLTGLACLSLLSPARLVGIAEEGVLIPGVNPGFLLLVNTAWHGALLIGFRTLSLHRADRFLGRLGEPMRLRDIWNVKEDWRCLMGGRWKKPYTQRRKADVR